MCILLQTVLSINTEILDIGLYKNVDLAVPFV